jgi:hypothetical protein
MQRNILILVVYLSFLGVVLAHKNNHLVQVIKQNGQEEHLRSVYPSFSIQFPVFYFPFSNYLKFPSTENSSGGIVTLSNRKKLDFVTKPVKLVLINPESADYAR